MSFVMEAEPTYAGILKYLIDGGIDYITDLNLKQMRAICQTAFCRLVRQNDVRTNFEIRDDKEKQIQSDAEVKEAVKKRYGLESDYQVLLKLRKINLDIINNQVIELYKILKISEDRKGRMEVLEKALIREKKRDVKKEYLGTGEEELK